MIVPDCMITDRGVGRRRISSTAAPGNLGGGQGNKEA